MLIIKSWKNTEKPNGDSWKDLQLYSQIWSLLIPQSISFQAYVFIKSSMSGQGTGLPGIFGLEAITCPGWWNTHHIWWMNEWNGWSNAFYRPKFISLLGLDLSFHTGHWILVSFRTKLAPAPSICQGPSMASGIHWLLSRHILTSGLRVWGTSSTLSAYSQLWVKVPIPRSNKR